MIITRPSDPVRFVVLADPALDEIPRETLMRYSITRDISLLDLDALSSPATVFTALPLQPQYVHLIVDAPPPARWHVFSTHVTAIDPTPPGVEWVLRGGDKVIDGDAQNAIPLNVVEEAAGVIREWASSDGHDVPFSPPDTSWQTARVQRTALRAMGPGAAAPTTETASGTADADSSS